MPEQELRETLETLHRELSQGAALDPESRHLLAELASDIEALLAQERAEPAAGGPLAERLRAATERFEESHPDLTAVVGRLADLLANLGI